MADYDSEDGYWKALEERSTGDGEDCRAYLPTPKMIEKRKRDLKQLQGWGFEYNEIVSIMHKNIPPMMVVRRLVLRHGEEIAVKRVQIYIGE